MEEYNNYFRFNKIINRDDGYSGIPFGYAVLIAAVFEFILIIAAILILIYLPEHALIKKEKPIMVMLSSIPAPLGPVIKSNKSKPTPTKPMPAAQSKPASISRSRFRVFKHAAAKKIVKQVNITTPPALAVKEISKPTPAPGTIPAVQKGPVNRPLIAILGAEIRQKIKSSLVYPSEAKFMNMQGKVKVIFTYYNGIISNIKIIRRSSFSLLNKSAIKTLKIGGYPPPPKQLQNRALRFSIWIRFKLHR